MVDNYQCQWCKRTDERVLEWTLWRQDWRVKIAFYAHKDCYNKEESTSGDGHGVRVTA